MVESLINSASFKNSNYQHFKGNNNNELLKEKLESIEDKQGFLGKTWNGIKELTTLGVSNSDCEKMLDKYNNGEISFEEAVDYIESFDSKQETMSGLLSNILTGVGAIAVTTTMVAGGPIGWAMAFKYGAPVGAILKTGINTFDRMTNDIKGDALDAKTMAKDAISGVFTGATSAISSGVGQGIKTGQIATSIKNGVKCGAMCGGMSGASSYMTDVAFGDKEYDTDDLINNTLFSSMVSASVGGVVGGGMYGVASLNNTVGQATSKSVGETIIKDSTTSSIRKFLGTETKSILA